jgi:hypothetical protein
MLLELANMDLNSRIYKLQDITKMFKIRCHQGLSNIHCYESIVTSREYELLAEAHT